VSLRIMLFLSLPHHQSPFSFPFSLPFTLRYLGTNLKLVCRSFVQRFHLLQLLLNGALPTRALRRHGLDTHHFLRLVLQFLLRASYE